MCLQSDGRFNIVMQGEGSCLTLAAGDALPEFRLPDLRRGGQVVVISSLPTPVIDTFDAPSLDPDEVEFVIQAPTDAFQKWVPIDEAEGFETGAIAALRAGLPNVHLVHVAEKLRADAFRFLRFNKTAWDPSLCPLLNLVLNADGTVSPPTVRAKIATRSESGSWQPATEFVVVPVSLRLTDGTTGEFIFEVSTPLVNVDAETDDLWANVVPLADIELRISFSIEASQNGQREYFVKGYGRTVDGVTPLSDAVCETMLHGEQPDPKTRAAVLLRPGLALRRVNHVPVNAKELESEARRIAERWFGVDRETPRILAFAGLKRIELSGAVTEVRWNQDTFTTTVEVNTWHYPSQMARDRESLRKATQGAFAGESTSVQRRLELGGAGAVTPTVVIGPGQSVAAGGGGATILWATAEYHWLSGNTVWAMPRTSRTDSTPPTGASRVLLYLTLPLNATPHNVEIAAGSALAYVSIGENQGLCLSVKQGESSTGTVLPTPTAQYTVAMCLNPPEGEPGDPDYVAPIIGWFHPRLHG